MVLISNSRLFIYRGNIETKMICVSYSEIIKVKAIKIIAENIKMSGVNVSNGWCKCRFSPRISF